MSEARHAAVSRIVCADLLDDYCFHFPFLGQHHPETIDHNTYPSETMKQVAELAFPISDRTPSRRKDDQKVGLGDPEKCPAIFKSAW
jgi:hypothetical protein